MRSSTAALTPPGHACQARWAGGAPLRDGAKGTILGLMADLLRILLDYSESITAFAIFGLLHSVGAREPCKDFLARCCGKFFVDHFWRLVYCALSFTALYHGISRLHWMRHPANDVWLIDYPDWLWAIVLALHLCSVAFAYVAFIQSDYLEFLGFKQVWQGLRTLAGRPPARPLELFGTDRLEDRGAYGVVRHPMLAAGFWFLATSGPSLNNLSYLLLYSAYMLIGGYYEEKRLVRIFGDRYLDYRRRVGAFFPRLPPRNFAP